MASIVLRSTNLALSQHPLAERFAKEVFGPAKILNIDGISDDFELDRQIFTKVQKVHGAGF